MIDATILRRKQQFSTVRGVLTFPFSKARTFLSAAACELWHRLDASRCREQECPRSGLDT